MNRGSKSISVRTTVADYSLLKITRLSELSTTLMHSEFRVPAHTALHLGAINRHFIVPLSHHVISLSGFAFREYSKICYRTFAVVRSVLKSGYLNPLISFATGRIPSGGSFSVLNLYTIGSCYLFHPYHQLWLGGVPCANITNKTI